MLLVNEISLPPVYGPWAGSIGGQGTPVKESNLPKNNFIKPVVQKIVLKVLSKNCVAFQICLGLPCSKESAGFVF